MHNRHRFDGRPTFAILVFSLMLTAGLVIANSRSEETVETSGAPGRLVGEVRPPRQLLSPSVAPQQVVAGSGEQIAVALAAEVLALSVETDVLAGVDVVAQGAGEPVDESVSAASSTSAGAPDAETADEVRGDVERSSTTTQNLSVTEAAAPATTVALQRPTTAAPAPAASTTTTTTTIPRSTSTQRATTQAPATLAPTTQAPTTQAPTTQAPTTQAPTTQAPPAFGRYTVAQVIDGTIGAGDGGNPNEESPMGRHDASLYLPQGWNWAQGPTRNAAWGNLGTGGSRYAEWRCAVIPENGHNPPVPFRINVSKGAYYQFANGSWSKAFDANLLGGNHGGYLGHAGQVNADPFSSGHHGSIQWRQEPDGSFSAPWNANALMMHFWAGQRQSPKSGQTAEFLTSEVRLMQPDGQSVDLSRVRVLFQCGLDYYNTTGGQGTKVPGPGIAKYHRVTPSWTPGLWVTLPRNTDASSVSAFRTWLNANLPPNVVP